MNKFLFIIFLSGCFFGIYQRPRTVGEGNFDFSTGFALQFTSNPIDREYIEARGYGLLGNFNIGFSYGILKGLDVGFNLSGAGLGPFLKIELYNKKIGKTRHIFSITPYFLYDPFFSNSLGFRGDAIYTFVVNKYFEPFVFYQAYYHPYFEEFFQASAGYKPLGNVGNGYYQFFGLGSGFNIYIQQKRKSSKDISPDFRFNIELGFFPVYLSENRRVIPILNFAISFGGPGFFKCYRIEKETFCPGGIFLYIISALFS
ncbi:MAG: hypothetical protein N2504_00840 [candidate division WOR-3 bacterium]|nr:hypothetical protein [candidate division WOR-3 bacterium]MCX7947120.1 hypothetical protein [candidate division WOR-3 bacterium]MDW8149839.1 hypothetical protein [candidate division WOR-3 bacterium]